MPTLQSTVALNRVILVLLVFHIFRSSECSRRTMSSAPWLSYWHQTFPNVRAPQTLAHLVSPMTSADTVTYLKYLNAGSMAANSGGFCKAANLVCSEKASFGPTVCVAPFFYEYGNATCNDSNATTTSVFFKTTELSVGNQIVYPKLANDLGGRKFLPAAIANAMPFRKDKLSESLVSMNVPSKSNMAMSMEDTLNFCASKPAEGEVRECHSSMESMVDFAVNNMGTKVAVFSPLDTSASDEEVKIRNVMPLSSAEQKSMSCHDVMYPYLVYGCHVMSSSRILDVQMEKKDGSMLHGAAVCHMDTSAWRSDHPAFAALKTQPGKTAICHWVPQNNFLWVPAK